MRLRGAPRLAPSGRARQKARVRSLPTAEDLERVLLDAIDLEPDSEVVDEPDWRQIRTPSSRQTFRNQVQRARGSGGWLEARVAEVLADHHARGSAHRWVVGPSSSPTLPALLVDAGWEDLGPTWGMARPVDPPLDLRVEGLTTEAIGPDSLDLYGRTASEAWGQGPDFGDRQVRSLAGPLIRGAIDLWVARLDGAPVAISALRRLGPLGYLQGCAVVPAYRRRGLYGALVAHRVDLLRRTGATHAVVWADASGAGPACEKLGFTKVCEAGFFERPA